MSQYTDLLKKKGTSNVTIARSRINDARSKQEGNCYKCKKMLSPNRSKMVKDPITKENIILCVDCLVHVAQKK